MAKTAHKFQVGQWVRYRSKKLGGKHDPEYHQLTPDSRGQIMESGVRWNDYGGPLVLVAWGNDDKRSFFEGFLILADNEISKRTCKEAHDYYTQLTAITLE